MKQIYLDNAATTQVDPQVVKAILPYFTNYYGNASEPHSWGAKANEAIEQSREKIANFLGADKSEIIFTSCSTESINLAHKGLLEGLECRVRYPHIITTKIEHKAVLNACEHLKKYGKIAVTYLSVDKDGLVDIKKLKKAIRPNTALVSIMYVNNEIGTIEPIREIGEMLREYNQKHNTHIYFHTDATQAIQYLECNVDCLGVDLLSFTGHKIHAPKGVGVLYVRRDTPLTRQQDGGGQEFGLRSGTENVPYIVGIGKAIELIQKSGTFDHRSAMYKYMVSLRNELIKRVLKISDVQLTGHISNRIPHIASFVFKGIKGEDIVMALSKKGIACATGSACNSDNLEPSHVLKAIGLDDEWAIGSVRFSLSKYTKIEDISLATKELEKVVNQLRGVTYE